eukprot:8578577-Pyramimonas_sp.AAC.2
MRCKRTPIAEGRAVVLTLGHKSILVTRLLWVTFGHFFTLGHLLTFVWLVRCGAAGGRGAEGHAATPGAADERHPGGVPRGPDHLLQAAGGGALQRAQGEGARGGLERPRRQDGHLPPPVNTRFVPVVNKSTSFYGSSCADNGKGALNTPKTLHP